MSVEVSTGYAGQRETTAGDRFSVVEPKLSHASKAALIDVLRGILEEGV
jgi:hypothetical protein